MAYKSCGGTLMHTWLAVVYSNQYLYKYLTSVVLIYTQQVKMLPIIIFTRRLQYGKVAKDYAV